MPEEFSEIAAYLFPLPTPEGNIFEAKAKSMAWHGGTSFDPPAAGLVSPQQTSPASISPGGDEQLRKRKRSEHPTENGDAEGGEGAVGGGGAGSPLQHANGNNKPRHQPGVKRACNDCRQQKVWKPAMMARNVAKALHVYESTHANTPVTAQVQCRCWTRGPVQALRSLRETRPQLQHRRWL